ncbi:RusA family crossover junction endodeoxyribonuclease [Nocardiopsis tropica]|uniref:RusA family crossover junction endodeoxyribonuclease n=1 Tax=Nocardiopsis tropica TaxID=109330 RepID=A0ABU7KM11_9ACTN|nr:RusA family crossover junction endodeoxyribonuclease [Nocardiopsis umidischolae]MEE2050333.1 RusA family crossover junction endodeoxyribonuclease [Nocardiopsis umidischolae]
MTAPTAAPTTVGAAPALSPRTAALTVTAYGHPAPQGSKRHVGGGRMIESSKRLPDWRTAVQAAADAAIVRRMADDGGYGLPLDGPLVAEITVTVPRPKSAPKTRVTWPQTRSSGDLDKLIRGVLDAIDKAGAIADDSRVVELTARKVYPHEGIDALPRPGVVVHLWPLPAAEVPQ